MFIVRKLGFAFDKLGLSRVSLGLNFWPISRRETRFIARKLGFAFDKLGLSRVN